MKQEKITPESFEGPIRKEFPHHTDLWIKEMAKKYYQLHLQSLQQLLDEASEELPSLKEIDLQLQAMKYNEFESALWMRSEAAKTVVKLKEDNDRSIKALGNSYDKARAEIQQLKEELARREGLDGFFSW